VDTNAPGRAQDYRVTADATGTIDRLSIYLDGGNSATKIAIALYAAGASNSRAGARLAGCTIDAPQADGWNRCTISALSVTSGRTYWTAVLQPQGSSGTLRYRNRNGGGRTFGSSSSTLTTLPASWVNGPSWGNQTGSIYADASGSTPPPPPADSDKDGVPDSQDQCPNEPGPATNQGCPVPPPPVAQCADKVDNDGDGKIDLADPGCSSLDDNDETDPPPSGNCDLNATPATLASQVGAATAGQTVCLATGSYGTWSGTSKAITVRNALGAAPTMRISFGSGDAGFTLAGMHGMGGSVGGGAHDITIRDSEFTAHIQLDDNVGANVVLDHNTHINIDSGSGTPAGRVQVWGSGVTVQNSLFQGGCADGIQNGGNGTRIIGNEFANLIANCSNHTDMIQLYGGNERNTLIKGNWFHGYNAVGGNAYGVLACYDGRGNGCVNETIEDNVFDVTGTGNRAWQLELYADQNSVVRHNTLVDGPCEFNLRCGTIFITHKSGAPVSTGTTVDDNVAGAVNMSDTVSATENHNLVASGASSGDLSGRPTFVDPTRNSWADYHLAAGSLGTNAASDGLDIGIR